MIKNMSIIKKIVASFVLITIGFFAVFYTVVYQNYYTNTLRRTENVSNQFYLNLEGKLTSFVNQVFSSSTEIYNSAVIKDLIIKFQKETDPPAKDIIKNEIMKNLAYFMQNHEDIYNIHLYLGKEHLYVNRQYKTIIGEYFIGTGWYDASFTASGNILYVPTYEQQFYNFKSEKVFSFIRLIKDNYHKPLAVLAIDYEEKYLSDFYINSKPTDNSFNLISLQDGKYSHQTIKT